MPPPYTLFVSGGVDSQAMLYAWMISGVPFTAIHVSYGRFNMHDFDEMYRFAERYSIKIQTLEFDILEFLENKLDDYAWTYQCSSPQLCTHMAFTECVTTGTKILSGNPPILNQPSMNNTIFGLQRYATIANVNMVPFFLMADPLSASIAAKTASELPNECQDVYVFKCQLYEALGIPVIPQKTKLTGFELLKDHYDMYAPRITSDMRMRHSGLKFARTFDHLFRNKYMVVLKNDHQTKFKMRK